MFLKNSVGNIHFRHMLIISLLFSRKIVICVSEIYAVLMWFVKWNRSEFKQICSSVYRAILKLAGTNIFLSEKQNALGIYFN